MIGFRCTWDDWAATKARLGLTVLEVIQGPGAETTIVVDRFPMSEMSVVIGSVMERKTSEQRNINKLARQLDILTDRAEKEPGKPVRVALPGGMRVDVIIQDGFLRMQVSRIGSLPSAREFETTVKYMPYDLTPVEPVSFEQGGANYIRGSWEYGQHG